MEWQPIQDIPQNWHEMTDHSLHLLASIWNEQRSRMEATQSYQLFLAKLRRRIAIETGVIERLYTIDRGVTRLLIEEGIDAALIQHGTTDRPASEVVQLIRDHEQSVDVLFDFVAGQRNLSTSFIKQLHQLLTRHQEYTEATDPFGKPGRVALIRGDWKKFPNNPQRADGTIHHYCPPEQVSSQMDQLIAWHLEHQANGVSPEVEAAWLHHRFTQIHPFQDGNGRVARNLATLVFVRAGWFPLVVLDDENEDLARTKYIDALEKADDGDLKPLVDLFAENQKKVFISSLSISEEAISETTTWTAALDAAIERIKRKQIPSEAEATLQVQQFAERLFQAAADKFRDVEREIGLSLSKAMPGAFVRLDKASSDDERAGFYRYQIIQTARKLNYYANLSGYRSWLRLAIGTNNLQTEILLSFHVLGYKPSGIMICTACGYRRSSSDDIDTSFVEDLQPLSTTPFEFTYQEDQHSLEDRFKKWLDEVLILGIDYWQKGL
ncbi:MAG: Fic family protein [Anaerolineae bacterium]|nr:Fic family protein [Anaerolineae bacterium]